MLLAYMAPDIFAELKKGSAETLILALLEDGPRHGYELSKLIDDRTGGRLTFHVANVYTSLYRLERAGFIVGRWVEKAGERRRRFYRLTAAGHRELAAPAAKLARVRGCRRRRICTGVSDRHARLEPRRSRPHCRHSAARRPDDGLVEELALHLAQAYEDARAEGMSHADAEARTLRTARRRRFAAWNHGRAPRPGASPSSGVEPARALE